MAKKKKKKPKYNKESAIISALKRTYSRSPSVSELYNINRKEFPNYKKDGTLAKRPAVRFQCVSCKEWHMRTNTQADHMEPVVPLNIPLKHACMDMIIHRLWVDTNKLQILCKPCHKIKSKEENAIRREWKSKDKIKHIIYKTTNRLNGRFYIGIHSTNDYDDGYLGSGKLLKQAVDKYGKDAFYRKILYVFDTRQEALEVEQNLVNESFIKDSQNYNITIGGEGGIAFMGRNCSDETRAKISKANSGKKRSQETKDKIKKARLGTKRSEITCNKLKHSKKATSPVVCNTNGQEFESIEDAAKALDLLPQAISRVCRGLRKTTGGYSFSYKKGKIKNK